MRQFTHTHKSFVLCLRYVRLLPGTRDEEGIAPSTKSVLQCNSLEIDKFGKLDDIIYNTRRKIRKI